MQVASFRMVFLPTLLVAMLLAWATSVRAEQGDTTDNGDSNMIGAGVERLPAWQGSSDQRNQPIPFLQVNLPLHITVSSSDGLTVDLIHGTQWHGGFYGNYQWGRETSDLPEELRGVVASLSPRLNAGGYVEYQATPALDVGSTLSHDTQGAGAYLNLYAEYALPKVGYLQHEFELKWQAMNGSAMRRFFGIEPMQAIQLDTPSWQPGASSQQVSLEYDAFMPTSLHTGLVLGLQYARLVGNAQESPLVKRFGSADQFTTTLAFVYRYDAAP